MTRLPLALLFALLIALAGLLPAWLAEHPGVALGALLLVLGFHLRPPRQRRGAPSGRSSRHASALGRASSSHVRGV